MLARMRVRGRMTVRRVIAAARRAAFLAYEQMNPTSAHFHALIALKALCMFDRKHRHRIALLQHDCSLTPLTVLQRYVHGSRV